MSAATPFRRSQLFALLAPVCIVLLGALTLPVRPSNAQATLGTAKPGSSNPSSYSQPVVSPTPDCGLAWRIVPTSNQSRGRFLAAISATSANDVWAVGSFGDPTRGWFSSLVTHWNGTGWAQLPSPNIGSEQNELTGVAAVSPSDVWAVGYYFYGAEGESGTGSVIMHWNGTSWSLVPHPSPATTYVFLSAISANAANDVWAVGRYTDNAGTEGALILHWNGVSWSQVPAPQVGNGVNALTAVAAISTNDVWAVGHFCCGTIGGLFLHWDGSQWASFPGPSGHFSGVAGISSNDVWAVGYGFSTGGGPSRTIAAHWDGLAWREVPSPTVGESDNELTAVDVVSANNAWAVGYYGEWTHRRTLVHHWDGTAWSVVPSPNVGDDDILSGVVALSARDVWASGLNGNWEYSVVARYSDPCPSRCPGERFSDVCPTDYFYEAVIYLNDHGVISGYSDGTFRPLNNTTRAQLAKITVLAEDWTLYTPPTPTFNDVPATDPFYQYIETAYQHEIISGYSDGTFRPGNDVTRGQLCKIVVLAEGWPLYLPPMPSFVDVREDSPFYMHVETAYERGIISGYADGTFRPGNPATRGQICKIVYNAVNVP